jgi:hypothetical protein
MVSYLVRSTVVDDLKLGNIGGLASKMKRSGEYLPFDKLTEAKIWREQQFGHVKKHLTSGATDEAAAVLKTARQTDAGEVIMQNISLGERGEKSLQCGPLAGLLTGKKVDVLWYELETDGMPDSVPVTAWISSNPECMLITCGSADATDKLMAQLQAIDIPHLSVIHVFCKDEPPFAKAPAKNQRNIDLILTFITPKLLKPYRTYITADIPFRPSIIASALNLLDITSDGLFQHMVYSPMKDRTKESVVKFVGCLMCHCVSWQVSCVLSGRESEALSAVQLRTKVQDRVEREAAHIDDFRHEMLLISRGTTLVPGNLAHQKDDSTITAEYRKAFRLAKKVAKTEVDNESDSDPTPSSNARSRDESQDSLPAPKKQKALEPRHVRTAEMKAREKAAEKEKAAEERAVTRSTGSKKKEVAESSPREPKPKAKATKKPPKPTGSPAESQG